MPFVVLSFYREYFDILCCSSATKLSILTI
jgi:hypothetical protein